MSQMLDRFKSARQKGVPLVCITTPDPAATVQAITKLVLNGKPEDEQPPIVEWDICRGPKAVDVQGVPQQAAQLWLDQQGDTNKFRAPPAMLLLATKIPDGGVLVMHNMQNFLRVGPGANESAPVSQGAWNLRDAYKTTSRTLILLCPQIELPQELQQDVLVLDEPLPTEAELEAIAKSVYGAGYVDGQGKEQQYPPLTDYSPVTAALTGLAAFPAEQAVAMSLTKQGFNLPELWVRKRKTVEQTHGLSFEVGNETFEDIGGLSQIKDFFRGFKRQKPKFIWRIEEIEKAMAGSQGDLSGVSQGLEAEFLTAMEDYGWSGLLAFGCAGTGKSLFNKALGNAMGCGAGVFNFGALQHGIVGSSGERIRAALKTIYALSGRDAFFIASCNRQDTLKPELKRRFKYGIWFWDLPDRAEKDAIWKIQLKKYEIPEQTLPNDADWSGSDIRNVCEIAWRMEIELKAASQYIVPAYKSASKQIDDMRDLADGKFLSASYPGVYRKAKPGTARKISVD